MKQTNQIRVGLCGLGTVGSGVVDIFAHNKAQTSSCELAAIGARRTNPLCDTTAFVLQDIFAVAKDPNIDIVVELIGGISVARELIKTAIKHGKCVVTANKALIAEYGEELADLATQHNVSIAYEAAVAGGIPIIETLRHSLASNEMHACTGIINGTSNFILSQMRDKNLSFAVALSQAQELGYAEADPTFDIDGTDIAHKLAILIKEAFHAIVNWQDIERQPLTIVKAEDALWADELGYVIKMIGRTIKTKTGDIEASVYPMLIKNDDLLADIHGTMNGILLESSPLGKSFYYGAGAGKGPTASAVVSDILAIASDLNTQKAFYNRRNSRVVLVPFAEQKFAFYWHLFVPNKTGMLAEITTTMSQQGINIEALLQKESTAETASIAIITFPVMAKSIVKAQEELLKQHSDISAHYLPILSH